MKYIALGAVFLIYLGSVIGSVPAFAEKVFYMYKDDRGRTVMQDFITEEKKRDGYRIVNANGVTLKVVPPQRRGKKKQQTPVVKNYSTEDLRLLRAYSSIQDIQLTRDSRLKQLTEIIESVEEHTAAFERNLAEMRVKKRSLEAAGQAADADLLEHIISIEKRITQNRHYLARKHAERALLMDKYEQEIERFKVLTSQATE